MVMENSTTTRVLFMVMEDSTTTRVLCGGFDNELETSVTQVEYSSGTGGPVGPPQVQS